LQSQEFSDKREGEGDKVNSAQEEREGRILCSVPRKEEERGKRLRAEFVKFHFSTRKGQRSSSYVLSWGKKVGGERVAWIRPYHKTNNRFRRREGEESAIQLREELVDSLTCRAGEKD